MQFGKKLCLILMAMLLVAVCASAEMYVELPAKGLGVSQNITVRMPGENPDIPGINPLTGENWVGLYHPVLVSTDNHPEALPHWGTSYADILYEFPIQMDGSTRMIALYMGEKPTYAGPVRSGRVIMAKLREMWNGGWVFYGWQSSFGNEANPAVDVVDFATMLHDNARQKGRWVFPYIEGMEKNYSSFFHRETDGNHKNPHNVQVDMRMVESLFGSGEPMKHPFKFSPVGLTYGADVTGITVNYKTTNPAYVTGFEFNPMTGKYARTANGAEYYDALNGVTCEFANVIIIRTSITSQTNNASRVMIQTFGQGPCEIFQNGKYVRGTWVQSDNPQKANEYNSLTSRMIFFDPYGNELEMKVGKTAILFINVDQPVIIRTSTQITGAQVVGTPAPTATPIPTRVPKPTRAPKPQDLNQVNNSNLLNMTNDNEEDKSLFGN